MKFLIVCLLAVCPAAFALMADRPPSEVWVDSRTGQMYVLEQKLSTNCWDIKPEFYPDSSLPGLGFQASIKYSLKKYSPKYNRFWFGSSGEEARVQSVDSCPEGWTKVESFRMDGFEKTFQCDKVLPLPNLTFFLDTGISRTIRYSRLEKEMILRNCFRFGLYIPGGAAPMIAEPDYFNAFVVRDDFGVYHEVVHLRDFDYGKRYYKSYLYYKSDSWHCASGWYDVMGSRRFKYKHVTCFYDLPDPEPFDEKLSPLKWTE